jgi:hypothetical protein
MFWETASAISGAVEPCARHRAALQSSGRPQSLRPWRRPRFADGKQLHACLDNRTLLREVCSAVRLTRAAAAERAADISAARAISITTASATGRLSGAGTVITRAARGALRRSDSTRERKTRRKPRVRKNFIAHLLLNTTPTAPKEVGRVSLVKESASRPQAVAAGNQLVMHCRHPMLADDDVATRVNVHMPFFVRTGSHAATRTA